MLAKFFNKSSPINTLMILSILGVIFLVSSLNSPEATFSLSYIGKRLIQLILVAISLFLCNFIVRKNELTKENSYFLLLLICFFGMFPQTTFSAVFLIKHLILLMAFRRIYSLKSVRRTKEKLFDAGFWIGITFLINPYNLIFLILIYAALISFKKFTPRHIFIPIVGLISPIFIYGVYLFADDRLPSLVPNISTNFSLINYNSTALIIGLTLLIGFLIWGLIPTTIKIMTVKLELKSQWYLGIMHLVLSLLFVVSQPDKNGSELLLLFFPTAVIFTNYLQQNNENWFKEVFLYLFLLSAFILNFLSVN